MKEELQTMAENFSFDMDLNDLKKDMTAEEIAKKMKELEEEYSKQNQSRDSPKAYSKKSAKQLQKEEKERQL